MIRLPVLLLLTIRELKCRLVLNDHLRFLIISEIYYPDGWIALLNGEEIPIHKTNYLLRGVQIPAGSHTLELDFRPSSFYNGVKLSWLSLLFQIGLACFLCAKFIIKKNKGA